MIVKNKKLFNIGQLWKKLEKAKEVLPSTCRIGETIFTSMAFISGRIYSNHHKNLNHVHKDSKGLVSVIITLGGNISGGDTVFYDGVKTSDFGSRAHVLKHIHGRMIFVPFEKKSWRYSLKWIYSRDLLYPHKTFFIHFFCHEDRFNKWYINTTLC